MANRDMKLDILVKLKDQMTGGLNRLTASLEKTSHAARQIGAVGGIIAGISFIGPMQEAAAFQGQLLDIAATAELSGSQAFAFADEAKRKYEDLALHIGQTSHNIAEGAQIMIAAGLSTDEIDASIEGIEKATTAANAAGGEMARLGTSLIQNLKLPADQVKDALGALMVAGKEGSFEMSEMAREFPQLTSGFANMGITGRAAVNSMGAFLEMVRKGTATSAEAATNLKNLVSEIQSPRVVRNFEKMGVDIQAVMKDAVAKGIDPLEAAIQKAGDVAGISSAEIGKYMQEAQTRGLKGADAIAAVREKLEKLGRAGGLARIFGNQMSRDAVVAILANVEEFNRIKNKVAAATGEIIDKDAATKMAGFAVQLTTLGEIGTQAGREIGYAFNEWLPDINAGLAYLLKSYRELDEQSGGFLKKLLSFGAIATLAAVAIGGIGLALPLVTAGFAALGAVIGALLSPIGLFIALLAGMGVIIYKNWDKIAPKIKTFWQNLKGWSASAWAGIKNTWANIAPYMSRLWGDIERIVTNVFSGINWDNAGANAVSSYNHTLRALGATWQWLGQVWQGFKPALGDIGSNIKNTFGTLSGAWDNIKGVAAGFAELYASMSQWLGLGDKAGSLGEILGQIVGWIAKFQTGNLKLVADGLQILAGALRSILDLLNGKAPDWQNYFPKWLVDYVNWLGGGLLNISKFMHKIFGDNEGMPGMSQMTPDMVADMQQQAQKGEALLKQMQDYDANRTAGDFFRKNGGINSLPYPAAQAQKNEIVSKVEIYDNRTKVSQTINGKALPAGGADAGLAVGRP